MALGMFILAMPLAALASSNENEEIEPYDARILNYPQNVQLDSGSTGLTWFLLVVLAGLSVGVMFKNANRSHLD